MDLGPQSCVTDPLGYETGAIFDDYLSNLALDNNISYCPLMNIFCVRILELEQHFPQNAHFSMCNRIHLTKEAVQTITSECGKIILNKCTESLDF